MLGKGEIEGARGGLVDGMVLWLIVAFCFRALFVATTVLTAHEFIRSRGRATGPVGGDGAKV